MYVRQRLGPVIVVWLATTGAAFAAEEDALRNAWALKIQDQLLRWGIWYTGLHRLDDGALFGFGCCIILTCFMVSAIGLLIFRARGLNFTLGWIVGVPVCIASLLLYSRYKPFPTYDDLSWMFSLAGAAQLAVLALVRGFRALGESRRFEDVGKDEPKAAAPTPTPARTSNPFRKPYRQTLSKRNEAMQDRLNLAMRPQTGRGRKY